MSPDSSAAKLLRALYRMTLARLRGGARRLPRGEGTKGLEPLEPRVLLSGDPIGQAEEAALLAGLTEFAGFADSLEQHGQLATALPVIGLSLGGAADLSDIVDRGLVQPLAGYFAAGERTPDELAAK